MKLAAAQALHSVANKRSLTKRPSNVNHRLLTLLLGAVMGLPACSSSSSGTASKTDTDSDVNNEGDAGTNSSDPSNAGSGSSGSGSSGSDDAGASMGSGNSASNGNQDTDAGTGNGNGTNDGQRTLADYLECTTDSDCPVGFGDCVTKVPFNVEDANGESSASLGELFPELGKAGVCTRVCTNGAESCEGLSIKDARGERVEYSCQLVVVGASPYPSASALPHTVNPDAMTAGVAFGAVCRPPFSLHSNVPSSLCTPCEDSAECGEGVCYNSGAEAEGNSDAPGECLMACSATSSCPGGFTCEDLTDSSGDSIGDYCKPLANTCSACLDQDGDGRGVGHCGEGSELTSPVDCDDTNPNAYYDASDMTHSFPGFCGEYDYNCNGLSDATEQLTAPDLYGGEHCGTCGDSCSGDLLNGVSQCYTSGDDAVCGASCTEGWADCTDEPGCETAVDDPSQLYYVDTDGDGFGDALSVPLFACGGEIPSGTVNNADDCDDTSAEIHPNASEQCDGVDNDCNGTVDDGAASDAATWYKDADGDGFGDLDEPEVACAAPQDYVANADDCNDQNADRSPGAADDNCDGIDDNCSGTADDDYTPSISCDSVDASLLQTCQNGALVCACVPTPGEDIPGDNRDSNCDGFDGDVANSIFVSDPSAGGNTCTGTQGTSAADPCFDLQVAIDRAETEGKSVIVEIGLYASSTALRLADGVSIYGGFDFNTGYLATTGITKIERSGSGHQVAAFGNGLSSPTRLFNFALSALTPTDAGKGTYGLVCENCSGLILEEMLIAVEGASNGAAGVTPGRANTGNPGLGRSGSNVGGSGGSNYQSGGKGGNASRCSGGNGVAGTGPGGARGTGGSSPSAGTVGGVGTANSGSAFGANGYVWESWQSGVPLWTATVGLSGGVGAAGGGGGGGGGYAEYQDFLNISCDWGGGGGGGGGGQGGRAGYGGGAAGSSIGLLVRNSAGLLIESLEIRVGAAGGGGAGGEGGEGGNGGSAGSGGAGGKNGGKGGKGGKGGGGGGGGGGSSINILLDTVTRADLDTTNLISAVLPANAGAAGSGGGAAQAGIPGHACNIAEVESTGAASCIEESIDIGASTR